MRRRSIYSLSKASGCMSRLSLIRDTAKLNHEPNGDVSKPCQLHIANNTQFHSKSEYANTSTFIKAAKMR